MASADASAADASALLARLHPSLYLSQHLAYDARPSSSRKPLEFPASVEVNLGPIASSRESARATTTSGSAKSKAERPNWLPSPSVLAKYGSTTVICNITPSIVYPSAVSNDGIDEAISTPAASPSASTIIPSISLTPLSSPSSDFRSGAPSQFAQTTTEKLFEFLDCSNLFDPAVLDIPLEVGMEEDEQQQKQQGAASVKAKWCLFADCTVIGFDGALLEASFLAVVAALRQLWLPKAYYSMDDSLVVASPTDYWSLRDEMDALPLAFSFGIYESKLLAAPSSFEADLCTSHLSCSLCYQANASVSTQTTLSALHSTGPLRVTNVPGSQKGSDGRSKGGPLEDEDVIAACVQLAGTKGKEIVKMLLGKEQAAQESLTKKRQA